MKYIYLTLLAVSLAIHAMASKPNVIVIMADDLGFGDIGCYGAKPKNLKTPHIDQLAKEGLRFTSGYCSASTCTPTRYSFLTGNYAFRRAGTGIAPPNGPSIIQPGEKTIGDLLKRAGYRTAVIGKWHLGLGAPGKGPDWNGELKPGPREIGFDYNFLLPTTNDRVPQVYVENSRVLNLDPSDPLWVGMKSLAKITRPESPIGIPSKWIGLMAIIPPFIMGSAGSVFIRVGILPDLGMKIWPINGWRNPRNGLRKIRKTHSFSFLRHTTFMFPASRTSVLRGNQGLVTGEM